MLLLKTVFPSTVVPQYLLGIGPRTCRGYQNPQILKSHDYGHWYPGFHIHGFNQPGVINIVHDLSLVKSTDAEPVEGQLY